jgi:hypothetical protein
LKPQEKRGDRKAGAVLAVPDFGLPKKMVGSYDLRRRCRFACWGRKRSYNEPKAAKATDNKASDIKGRQSLGKQRGTS